MPLDGERLIIEPTYPYARAFEPEGPPEPDDGYRAHNQWFSRDHGCDIILMRGPDKKVTWGKLPAMHNITQQMHTLGCSDAWGIEQEARAVRLLAGLVSHRQFRQYMLTGAFLEKSTRSGVVYMFRRLRPTVALEARPGLPDREAGSGMRMLAALCMHPIAYYDGSWAGAMCPTDDVVAHLQMMRGDEHMFWKRCNQHPPHRPEAGL